MRESSLAKKDDVPWVIEKKHWKHLNTKLGDLGPMGRGGRIMMCDNKRKQEGYVRGVTDTTDAGCHTFSI
jgi:hypothetical protein